jgi:hypothetical protein
VGAYVGVHPLVEILCRELLPVDRTELERVGVPKEELPVEAGDVVTPRLDPDLATSLLALEVDPPADRSQF